MKYRHLKKSLLPVPFLLVGVLMATYGIIGVKTQQSSRAATPIITTSNVAYDSANKLEVLDILQPSGASKAPVLVVIHGGGWWQGDKSDLTTDATQMAQAGFVVFNIDYPLDSTSVRAFPMELNDTQTAVRWVIAHAAQYGGDATRLGIVGGSAGGHLADMAGLQMNAASPGTVKAVVPLSGVSDLYSLFSVTLNDSEFSSANLVLYKAFGCLTLSGCSQSEINSDSPLYNINKNCPAFLIFNSDNEPIPLSQATSFNSALSGAGCNTQLQEVSGTLHAFAYWSNVSQQVLAFFSQKLAAAVPPTVPGSTGSVPSHTPSGGSTSTPSSHTTTSHTNSSSSSTGTKTSGSTNSDQSSSMLATNSSSPSDGSSSSAPSVTPATHQTPPSSPKHPIITKVAYTASGTAVALLALFWFLWSWRSHKRLPAFQPLTPVGPPAEIGYIALQEPTQNPTASDQSTKPPQF